VAPSTSTRAASASKRRRAKLSTTVDADLLAAVDRFIAANPSADRSQVIDEALLLWYAQEQRRAMRAQYQAPQSEEEQAERAAWEAIRREANRRHFGG